MSNVNHPVIAILPRIRFHKTGQPHCPFVEVGSTIIWRDSEELWKEQFGRDRPSWLKIFRDFADVVYSSESGAPVDNALEEQRPAYGSVIVCKEPNWLEANIANLIGVLYYLSGPTCTYCCPAESFEYYLLATPSHKNDDVVFVSKSGQMVESASSLILSPPLALRGRAGSTDLDLKLDQHAELVARFFRDPNDRIVVACRHLFRASFDDLFRSPLEGDIAAYCACLEATFNLPERSYKENLADEVTKLFDLGSELRDFMIGAYAIRSVFNHGSLEDAADPRYQLVAKFRSHWVTNILTLRHICVEAIRAMLLDSMSSPLSAHDRRMLDRFSFDRKRVFQHFRSDQLWKDMAKIFENKVAFEDTCKKTSECNLIEQFCEFVSFHDWELATIPHAGSIGTLIQARRASECIL